jgi:predicted DNA-binding transcriptional regulator AlpA
MAKDGRLPKPVRIGTRMLRWARDDIQNIIDDYESKQALCNASH